MEFALARAARKAAAVVSPIGGSSCPFVITGFLEPPVGCCDCLKAVFERTALERGRLRLLNREGPGPREALAGPSMSFQDQLHE